VMPVTDGTGTAPGPKPSRRQQAPAEGSAAACHLQHRAGCGFKLRDWSARLQHPNGCLCKAVVRDLKAACAVGLEVGKAMQAGPAAVKRNIHPQSTLRHAAELPLQVLRVSLPFLEATEDVRFPIVPQNCLSKHQPEGHVVDQRFQRAHSSIGSKQTRMRPGPGVAMPVSTIMSLHPEPQRVPGKSPLIESDLPGKTRVGMRRSRKTNPALIAQRDPKGRAVVQIPRDRMPRNFQRAPAGVVFDPVVADSEVEWGLASGAEIKTVQGKSLNEGLRLAFGRKPCGPDLNWHPPWISGAPAAPRIHQQVAEPPRSTGCQSYTKKPDFVTAAHRG